jgi:hypothetical protein
MLGVIVIHPPKKTQPHAKFNLVAAHGAVAVGTYDAGLSLHSLPGKARRSSLLLDQGVTDASSKIASAALTPLSGQYEEPSIRYSVKLRAE